MLVRTGKVETIELTQENQYNGNGQRIRKSEADNTTKYFYQDGSVLYTIDGTDNLTSWNLLGSSEAVIGTTRGTGTAEEYYLYTNGGYINFDIVIKGLHSEEEALNSWERDIPERIVINKEGIVDLLELDYLDDKEWIFEEVERQIAENDRLFNISGIEQYLKKIRTV